MIWLGGGLNMIASKEQEEYIRANIEKAMSNSIKMYGRTWWDNIYILKN